MIHVGRSGGKGGCEVWKDVVFFVRQRSDPHPGSDVFGHADLLVVRLQVETGIKIPVFESCVDLIAEIDSSFGFALIGR